MTYRQKYKRARNELIGISGTLAVALLVYILQLIEQNYLGMFLQVFVISYLVGMLQKSFNEMCYFKRRIQLDDFLE